ncbi:hypothetical protein DFH07DRAFT_771059 [Mycena maculata]|uniref:Uncharacterized protein n=1 Tax=Mycena maculata TaxID=230809 RepID=A0AAD7NJ60_9AGAR|nr:hypothetical protein DFH07DRAFT_771059 [Mycena maculata]
MAASFSVTRTTGPTFPEDIERVIHQVLLMDAKEMRGTLSLVALRFHAWTKPIMFHTVVVRRHKNWMQRIRECFLGNAGLIQILILRLSFTEDQTRVQLSGEELSHIRWLLGASGRVKHLAVTWNIWAYLEPECGSLRLEGLFLIWDGALGIEHPSLASLKHPSALEDLTIFGPPDLIRERPFPGRGSTFRAFSNRMMYIPATGHCTSLAYLTYAANYPPSPSQLFLPRLKGTMQVIFGTEVRPTTRDERAPPNFSTAYVGSLSQMVVEWVAKMEGQQSILE